jgi:hypothetical protein
MELLVIYISCIGKLMSNIFFEIVNEMFHNFELSDSQYNGNAITQGLGTRQYS